MNRLALSPPSTTSTSTTPFELLDLFNILNHLDEVPWVPFRDGVRIHRLYGDGVKGPTAALICFDKGGKIAGHFHEGYEHILVLAGTQRDQHGVIHRGTLRINPPGTTHSVTSEPGCIVLAIYEKAVRFE